MTNSNNNSNSNNISLLYDVKSSRLGFMCYSTSYNSQITHQQNALYFNFLFFNPYTCFNPYKAIFRGLVMYIYFTSIVVCFYVIYHM